MTAICSTDQGWCELAAKDFQAQTGIKVLQVRKATGEAFAQIRAMSGNMVGGFSTSAIGFGWNEDVLKKKGLAPPRCWADLIDPKYKGEIETSRPGSGGTGYTILALGLRRAAARVLVGIGVSFMFGFDSERLQAERKRLIERWERDLNSLPR